MLDPVAAMASKRRVHVNRTTQTEGSSPERLCAYISSWTLISPSPTASPFTAPPTLGQAAWFDIVEAGFSRVLRPSLDPGVWKEQRAGRGGVVGRGEKRKGMKEKNDLGK